MAFHVGQKVVCVDNSGFEDQLSRGAVYIVTKACGWWGGDEWICINNGITGGYKKTRFRPVVERKTDIGVFHEILRKVTKRQEADA